MCGRAREHGKHAVEVAHELRGQLGDAPVVLGDDVGLRGQLRLRLLLWERLRLLQRGREGLAGAEAAARRVARDGAVAGLGGQRHRRLHGHAHRDPAAAACHRNQVL